MVHETRYDTQSQWGKKEPRKEERESGGEGRRQEKKTKERILELDDQWTYHNRNSNGVCSY